MSLADRVDGLLHEPTQVHEDRVDLSLAGVARVREPGAIDFGGGELAAAETVPLEPERRDPTDDYGWWELQPGTYLVECNESVSGPVRVEPRPALVARGGSLPTVTVRELPTLPLRVPEPTGTSEVGLALKENARIVSVRPPEA